MDDIKHLEHKKVTSKDVALYAGVSQSTVSRAFSPNGKLSDQKREKVLEAAEALGYRPNALARGLISSQTGLIGVVKGSSFNPMFSELLAKITEQIQKAGRQVIYYETGYSQSIDDIFDRILQYRVDGIILLYESLSSRLTEMCKKFGIPVLQMLRYSMNIHTNTILPDNQEGAAKAVRHLFAEGYQSFAYITGEMNSSSNAERQLGFITTLQEYGYVDPLIISGNYTYESGYQAIQELLQKSTLPCGVVCANDVMAMGVLDAAKSLHIRIPDDLGVIGFDDIEMSRWPVYQLTSLRQPTKDMAQQGVETLLDEISHPDRGSCQMMRYDFDLIVRGTTMRRSKKIENTE
ncbi:MAG: LacI family DNA-binding transcriptional regulator [Eubacteriales bacterium]|nr:LacI family DNA-binding transcriptional regulator [Eubacteriales bacterium]